jgi:hypothetical protein
MNPAESSAVDNPISPNLRARISQLRQELTATTAAYHGAAARHDSQRVIPLLRSRSKLMRELLEAQCELLLTLRSEGVAQAGQTSVQVD